MTSARPVLQACGLRRAFACSSWGMGQAMHEEPSPPAQCCADARRYARGVSSVPTYLVQQPPAFCVLHCQQQGQQIPMGRGQQL